MQADFAQAAYDTFLAMQDVIMNHLGRIERLETVTLLIVGWLVLITGWMVWKEDHK